MYSSVYLLTYPSTYPFPLSSICLLICPSMMQHPFTCSTSNLSKELRASEIQKRCYVKLISDKKGREERLEFFQVENSKIFSNPFQRLWSFLMCETLHISVISSLTNVTCIKIIILQQKQNLKWLGMSFGTLKYLQIKYLYFDGNETLRITASGDSWSEVFNDNHSFPGMPQ